MVVMGWWQWWVSSSGVGRDGGLAALAVGLHCSRAMPGEVRNMRTAAIPPSLVRRWRLAACGACPHSHPLGPVKPFAAAKPGPAAHTQEGAPQH